MSARQKKPTWDLRADGLRAAILLAVCLFLFFSATGQRHLWETDESRHAEVAREMLESGDWATPRLNYVKYFEKPPLTYWSIALSFSLFGVSEASARLATGVYATLTVLLTFLLGRSLFNREVGFWAGLILATSLMFWGISRVLLVDMPLCFGVVLSLYGAWELRQGKKAGLYGFWGGLALAFLSKGLLGPGLVVISLVLFCLAGREWDLLKKLANWRGILLAALISLPWVIWVSIKNPEFFKFFFIDEQFGRLLTNRHQRSQPFYFFLLVLPAAAFPWSILLPWALGKTWPGRAWRQPENRPWLYLFIWAAWFFLFFSLSSSKMLHYILPMLPALAVLIAAPFASMWQVGWRERAPRGIRASLAALGLAVMLAGLAPVLAPALNKDIGYQQVGVLLFVGPLLAAGLGLLVFWLRGKRWAAAAAPLAVFVVMVACVAGASPVLDDYRSVAGLVKPIVAKLKKTDVLASYGDYYHGAPFYSGRRVMVVNNWGELDFGRRHNANSGRWFVKGDENLIKLLQNPRRRYLIISEIPSYLRFKRKVKGKPGLLLFEWSRLGDKVLFSNRPR